MSTLTLDRKLLDDVIAVALRAGEVIQRVRVEGFEVTEKGSAGPVTRADREADALLHDELLKLVPAAWLSEETADDGSRLSEDTLWVVDPLDGTKEFVEGVPHYTVAIALVDPDGPALGVVHNPSRDETYAAVRGGGAYLNGEPMSVADGAGLGASRSEIKRGEFAPFEENWDVQPIGSIEYKLALVASGAIAATVSRGPKHEWDVCAGACLVA
ncbi:MAG: 3'(2'),5'-bisphosphate nucleotidase CysQ, partial [Planctomycetota bacterium]